MNTSNFLSVMETEVCNVCDKLGEKPNDSDGVSFCFYYMFAINFLMYQKMNNKLK